MSKFPVTSRTDVLPSENSFPSEKKNKTWGLQSGEGDENLPGNPLNNPVPLRKGKAEVNGWQNVVGDVFPDGDE